MAKMQVKGVEEYALKLSRLGSNTEAVAGKAIYRSADIVANAIKEKINSLEAVTEVENIKAYRAGKKARLTIGQKRGLRESFGISKMQLDTEGYYNVKLGFDGYNDIKTRKYPKGQPNALIARVVESGSSYMDKNPFIRKTVNAEKKAALAEMQRIIDEETKKIME